MVVVMLLLVVVVWVVWVVWVVHHGVVVRVGGRRGGEAAAVGTGVVIVVLEVIHRHVGVEVEGGWV